MRRKDLELEKVQKELFSPRNVIDKIKKGKANLDEVISMDKFDTYGLGFNTNHITLPKCTVL